VGAVAAPRIEGFRDRDGDTLYVPNTNGRRAARPFHALREQAARYTYPVPLSSQFLTCNTGATDGVHGTPPGSGRSRAASPRWRGNRPRSPPSASPASRDTPCA